MQSITSTRRSAAMMAVITLEIKPSMTTTAKAKAFTPSLAIAALTAFLTAGRRNLNSKPATRTAAVILIGSRRPSLTSGHAHCALTVTASTPIVNRNSSRFSSTFFTRKGKRSTRSRIANKATMTGIGSPF
jgi:hypothetical protein